MGKTYEKRIWVRNDVSVYESVVDSTPRSWRIVRARRTVSAFSQRDAAIGAAQRLVDGETSVRHTDELIRHRAANLKRSAPLDGGLDPRLLAALELMRLERETRSKSRIDICRLVGNLGSEAGEIPTALDDLEDWLSRALGRVTAAGNRTIASQSGLTARLQTFSRILRQIEAMPVVFRRWLHVPSIAAQRIQAYKRAERNEYEREESFQPLSRSEVLTLLGNCETFAQALSVIIYLTGGFRAGEPERIHVGHLLPDGLIDLPSIVQKEEVERPAPASVVLRAAVRWFGAHAECKIRVPEDLERKRMRPTAAVHLLLAKMTHLEVKERLGHASLAMLVDHYAKMIPLEFAQAKSPAHYFGGTEFRVGGHVVPGNQWDGFLLAQAIIQAQHFGVGEFRAVVLELISITDQGDGPGVVSL